MLRQRPFRLEGDDMVRKQTRSVECGGIRIGGGAPVSIQSMTNTDTRDTDATVAQILALERAGCQIVRVAIPDSQAAASFAEIRKKVQLPLVADIHFDYRLALEAIRAGADKVRINPGNIGSEDRVRAIVDAARERKISIRIGVNSGSIEPDILIKEGGPTAAGMVESVMRKIRLMESMNFENLVLSVKASDVILNDQAYRKLSQETDYPLHIGVTESGDPQRGTIKSSVGLGALLLSGIGDTMRVSLTGDPVMEIPVAREILKCTRHLTSGIHVVSCPTCARTGTDLAAIEERILKRIEPLEAKWIRMGVPGITLAIMGCAVNGPGEASHADLGVACGVGKGLLFKKGKKLRMVDESAIEEELIRELKLLAGEELTK